MSFLPVLIIVHQSTSNPGQIGACLQEMGYPLDIRIPAIGDELPETLDRHSATVIFGGPMSANDDDKLPHIRRELDWIPIALDSEKPFLGICLGAQLLARVLGANVSPHPDGLTELGYYPVRTTSEGRSTLGDLSCVYQWHREGFELPYSAVRLATGDTFPNQAFRYKNAYGLQFHPEMTKKILAWWLSQGSAQLTQPGAQPGYLHRRGHRRHASNVKQWLEVFLPIWLQARAIPETAMRHSL
ncbi:MAG: glutamine amidotransferase [Cyanobacteria bacterium SID2]|nr:glutamine amidotransferase [Cyanobacteria bacterium SID2]MBP0006670.1 glutamine amidotransferase [Cyanobacteria bacterium SBC]